MAKGAHRPAPHGTHCGAEGLLFTSAVFAGHCAAAGRQTTLATTSHSNTGNCLLGVPVIICGCCFLAVGGRPCFITRRPRS